jgi:hypothetical protein
MCIVNQIHDFATTRHRAFVIKHLEPWLSRAEELEELRFLEMLSDSSFRSESLGSMFEAEWVSVKEASKATRNAKAFQTRRRNRMARRAELSAEIGTPGPALQQIKLAEKSEDTLIKRKRSRGRPKKMDNKSDPKRIQRPVKKPKV